MTSVRPSAPALRRGQEPAAVAGRDGVTLIDGLAFVISDGSGEMPPGPYGLVVRDTRHLTRLALTVAGLAPAPLVAALPSATSARFHGYLGLEGLGPDAPLEVERRRRIAPDGLDEEIVLRLWSVDRVRVEVALETACDFADIFDLRRMRVGGVGSRPPVPAAVEDGALAFADGDGALGTRIAFDPGPETSDPSGRATWTAELERGGSWRLGVSVRADGDGAEPVALGRPALVPDTSRRTAVRSEPPALARACRRSSADLDALSMADALDPSRRLLAAGIPWFVALFGRDSIIASHQGRLLDPGRMVETLEALAARQGTVDDPANDEQPGKILHEVRLTRREWLGSGTTGGARPYYGSIDATPLFLMLYGTALRWGAEPAAVRRVAPAAWRALEWMRRYGDPDGDGLLEYRPTGPRSLANQSWKDSENAVQFPDGTLANGPIAMVEVQGYAYRARRDLAEVLGWMGEEAEAAALVAEAETLRETIRDRYWVEGSDGRPGYFAMALDGDKRRVDSVASNMGHLLWCGVPAPEEARQVAEHLAGPAMASGWGLRTLSADMAGFNPISYHVGSVWPHDTAIACEGLRRYGLDRAALRLAADLIEAAERFEDRLPELFGGHARAPGDVPIPYPSACRPQAWAAAVPPSLAAVLLGLEPDVPRGRIAIDPALPENLRSLDVRNVPFPGGVLSIDVDRRGPRLLSVPAGCVVELRPLTPPAGGEPA
ncbi:MAG TPA: glycogen debranching N-terminal domain-containing protein [Miltoncostaeaceae bacterium]|nr:glycogen debranching N-terminal domain-containing protein [Miltoncostaeaceae bacterium]